MYRSLEIVILEVVSFGGYGLGVVNTRPSADVEAPIFKQTGEQLFLKYVTLTVFCRALNFYDDF